MANGSITVDSDNNVYIVFSAFGNPNNTAPSNYVAYLEGGEWKRLTISNLEAIDMGRDHYHPHSLYDPQFNLKFLDNSPPLITSVSKGENPRIVFRGHWQEGEEIPLEESTAIYRINRETDELIVWVQRDDNVTITAFANDQEMEKETEGNEDQFSIQLSESAEIELKFEMTQPDGDEVRRITKVLGGVARV
ncbi:hypothetical protein JCM19037_4177 [Geomicrobium sp. JCM 19037]|nr:hypothetical protein JCM19037_4177 [Geomicrobium sp. JCM 19037]